MLAYLYRHCLQCSKIKCEGCEHLGLYKITDKYESFKVMEPSAVRWEKGRRMFYKLWIRNYELNEE